MSKNDPQTHIPAASLLRLAPIRLLIYELQRAALGANQACSELKFQDVHKDLEDNPALSCLLHSSLAETTSSAIFNPNTTDNAPPKKVRKLIELSIVAIFQVYHMSHHHNIDHDKAIDQLNAIVLERINISEESFDKVINSNGLKDIDSDDNDFDFGNISLN